MIDLKKISLTIGIAVLFALFIGFTIDAIYQAPKYETYCNISIGEQIVLAKGEAIQCPIINDQSISNSCYQQKGEIRYEYNTKGCPTRAYCDLCSAQFYKADEKYNLRVFYIAALVGIIAILIGLFISLSMEAIASGLMFGGILTVIYGTIRGFGSLGRYTKPLVLGIELVIVLLIAYKKRDKNSKRRK